MKRSLRLKFFLLIIPMVAIALFLLGVAVTPYNRARGILSRVEAVIPRTFAAERFSRLSRLELSKYVETGLTGGASVTPQYLKDLHGRAVDALDEWAAEAARPLDETWEAALERLPSVRTSYEEMTRSGRRAADLAFQGDLASSTALVLAELQPSITESFVPVLDLALDEEQGLLSNDLSRLLGSTETVFTVIAAGVTVTPRQAVKNIHEAILEERFAGDFSTQVAELGVLVASGGSPDVASELAHLQEEARLEVRQAIALLYAPEKGWEDEGAGERLAALAYIDWSYESLDVVTAEVAALAGTDQAAAAAIAESQAVPLAGEMSARAETLAVLQEKTVETNTARIESKASARVVVVVIAAFIIILIGVGSPLLLSRQIVKPIVALKDAAGRLGAGDLEARAEVGSRDELGDLAQTFNEMATSRMKTERELEESRDQLEVRVKERTAELQSANAELTGYAHTVSHDLRGPLSAIKLANDTLQKLLSLPRRRQVEEDIEKTADVMNRNIEKSSALIADLLSLAEAGQEPRLVRPVDVSAVLSRVVEERSGSIAERGASVALDDDLGTVVANETHVYQVFNNLVGNALKHSDNPRTRIEVRLLGDDGEGMHRYLVRDNGSGIPPEDIGEIFEPFFKGAKSGETGIGLATVDKIVKVYGGEIRAYNDAGACFEFTLRDWSREKR